MNILIRPITISDAAQYIELGQQLDQETKFMLLEPGERSLDIQKQKDILQSILKASNKIIFVAETKAKLVGYIAVFGGNFKRNYSTAQIVIGVLQAYTGQGLGRELFAEVFQWATAQHLHRLELTVMAHNENALSLYQKQGFVIEGVKKDSLLLDGDFVDEYYMGRLLN